MLTRVFKSGNSMAVRIPKELAFPAEVQDVEIERLGLAIGAVLITNNEADFRDYPGLRIENWARPA
jgi:virulence-associated protein VagC